MTTIRRVLKGPALFLRCREIHDISVRVSSLVHPLLEKVAAPELTYTFKNRHKSPQKIYDKVIRKRAEGKEKNDHKLRSYDPDHVTDAWACRYVALYQTQIPMIVQNILAAAEQLNKQPPIADLTLSEFVIYTNRPAGDPLSIQDDVMSILDRSKIKRVIDKKTIIRAPENKKSAYSSVHLVFGLSVTVDLLNRRAVPEKGKFEIQVRDIFEEGWGEIQHNLLYSRKDGAARLSESDSQEASWKPHLNALKTFVDGCSQHASIIQRNYEFVRARRSPSPWISISERSQDKAQIISALRELGRLEAVPLVELAYELLNDASEEEDREIAADGFMAAASKFEAGLKELGPAVLEMVSDRNFKTIEYFLKLELANCYLFAKSKAPRTLLLRAKKLCLEMAERFPNDATIRFRLAQIIPALGKTPALYEEAIRELKNCIALVGRDTMVGEHHWLELSARTQLGRLYWLNSQIVSKKAKKISKSSLLGLAVKSSVEVVKIWDNEPDVVKHSETHTLFAHRAASNVLYYLSKLIMLGERRRSELTRYIKRFNAINAPSYAELYKSKDNLMHAYFVLGDQASASRIAFDNQSELVGLAEHRAGRRLKSSEIERYLTEIEIPNYLSAMRIISGEPLGVDP